MSSIVSLWGHEIPYSTFKYGHYSLAFIRTQKRRELKKKNSLITGAHITAKIHLCLSITSKWFCEFLHLNSFPIFML